MAAKSLHRIRTRLLPADAEAIAAATGISSRTVQRWRRDPADVADATCKQLEDHVRLHFAEPSQVETERLALDAIAEFSAFVASLAGGGAVAKGAAGSRLRDAALQHASAQIASVLAKGTTTERMQTFAKALGDAMTVHVASLKVQLQGIEVDEAAVAARVDDAFEPLRALVAPTVTVTAKAAASKPTPKRRADRHVETHRPRLSLVSTPVQDRAAFLADASELAKRKAAEGRDVTDDDLEALRTSDVAAYVSKRRKRSEARKRTAERKRKSDRHDES